MAVYFTSDTHFGDARRLRIDKRPFKTIGEHDSALIARWNEVVGPDDDVYHLGDFAVTMDAAAVESWLAALNGRKHLIVGNNDSPAVTGSSAWASISHYVELVIDGRLVVLCHYPFRTWHRSTKGAIDIHGHSHGKLKELPRQYDVGIDVFDYRPVTFAEILASRRRGKKAVIAKPATKRSAVKKTAKRARRPAKPVKKARVKKGR
jgi:calcineurin-like phosphoesterase family protein